MVRKRRSMQVDESFDEWCKKMRAKSLEFDGKDISARELTERICKSPELIEIEKRMFGKKVDNDSFNLRIKFDGGRRR